MINNDQQFEVGKTYKTKMSDGSQFKVEKEDKLRVYGYYVGKEHIGICPLNKERLIVPVKPLPYNDTPEISNWRKVIDIIDSHTITSTTLAFSFMPCVRELIQSFNLTKKNETKS